MNRAVGIRAKYITGSAIKGDETFESVAPFNHAYLKAFINGNWMIQDPMWSRNGKLDFFDPKPEVFNKDHREYREEPQI